MAVIGAESIEPGRTRQVERIDAIGLGGTEFTRRARRRAEGRVMQLRFTHLLAHSKERLLPSTRHDMIIIMQNGHARPDTERVVVTGLGAVTPIGNSAPAFWDRLLAGR